MLLLCRLRKLLSDAHDGVSFGFSCLSLGMYNWRMFGRDAHESLRQGLSLVFGGSFFLVLIGWRFCKLGFGRSSSTLH